MVVAFKAWNYGTLGLDNFCMGHLNLRTTRVQEERYPTLIPVVQTMASR